MREISALRLRLGAGRIVDFLLEHKTARFFLRLLLVVRLVDLLELEGLMGYGIVFLVLCLRFPSRHDGLVVVNTAVRDKVLPVFRALFSDKVLADELLVLEHMDHARPRLHAEGGTAGRTHDRERLPARCLHDLFLLVLVDAARILVKLHEILNVVRGKREDKAVLAGVDDRRGFSRDLLAADEVLDVLRDYDLHTVVLTDTLGELEHKVQRDGVFRVNKDVRLVDDDHDLAFEAVFHVVVAVLDDLVIDVFEYQQHLRVGDDLVSVGEHTLEIEHCEVALCRDRRRPVPNVRVAPAGGELGDVVHQRPKQGADVLVVSTLIFL